MAKWPGHRFAAIGAILFVRFVVDQLYNLWDFLRVWTSSEDVVDLLYTVSQLK